jgi:hypothetical protein
MNFGSSKKAAAGVLLAANWNEGANYAWNNIDCGFDSCAIGRATAMVA